MVIRVCGRHLELYEQRVKLDLGYSMSYVSLWWDYLEKRSAVILPAFLSVWVHLDASWKHYEARSQSPRERCRE